MSRLTIDFGIDLGTTNSSIAVLEKHGPRIIRNNENWQFTPSAVWADKTGALRVGMSAKERAFADPKNGATEFKKSMGKALSTRFERLGRSLSPEELSAEVLKSLKADVFREGGEDLSSAVITVPAAFDQPESEATRRAAKLAGITTSPLLQEPIAAALAYGFQHEHENVFWLVYDLGGGTFDAAVIHVKDGLIQVVNHGGDNNLGGKLIDWSVVEQLFVPVLTSEFNLHDFRVGNDKWFAAFAKLKMHAEKAKIALSKELSYEISGEFICTDDSGEPVQLETVVTRAELEAIIDPFLSRSVTICRNVLHEQKLGPGDMAKVVLVGGPTVTPYIRQVLPDLSSGLGISIDYSVDPLTVVAQGAALFAGSQKVQTRKSVVAPGQYTVALEYKPVGNDTEPLVGGRVSGNATMFTGYTVRISNPDCRPPWDSGRLPLSADGTFIANLRAEAGAQNTFEIQLFDPSGSRVPLSPSTFPYMVGLVITDPPLPHDIGIAMADNKVDVLFKKGTPLPAKVTTDHLTTVAIRKSDPTSILRIPFVEGHNSEHADLNRKIGHLIIEAKNAKRDLPMNSSVEIRLQIDASRLISGTVYIPVLDQEFPVHVEGIAKAARSLDELQKELDNQVQRLEELQATVSETKITPPAEITQIDREDRVGELSRIIEAGDKSKSIECDEKLLDLKGVIQKIEDSIEAPRLVLEAKQEIAWTEEALSIGTADDRKEFERIRPELEAATNGDTATLRTKVSQMFQLRIRILARTPDYWIGYRDFMFERKAEMMDQTQAQLWFSHADRAIKSGDIEGVKTACRQLWALLPKQSQGRGYGGGTVRARSTGA